MNLQSLSLITDGSCSADLFDNVDLTHFKHLRSLSWRGISRGDHFWSLGQFIRENSAGVEGLKSITLDLVDWWKAERSWHDHQSAILGGYPPGRENFFARRVLGVHPEEETVLFKSLESLSLFAVSFGFAESGFIQAFNMNNLRSLKLWNCPSSLTMLDGHFGENGNLNLTSFELVMDTTCLGSYMGVSEEDEEGGKTVNFINGFCGLKDLFLMLPPPTDWKLVGGAILNHRLTLERLVLHDRGMDPDANEVADGEISWRNVRDILCRSKRLSCLGTNIPISQLVRPYIPNDDRLETAKPLALTNCSIRSRALEGSHTVRESRSCI